MDDAPEDFWLGVEQFNQQQYYECHDTLEALWIEAIAPDKTFYQGILQIAVALYHLSNHNWCGSVTLLGEGIRRLRPYQPDYASIDVENLIEQSVDLLTQLQEQGADQVGAIAQRLMRSSAEISSIPVHPITIRRYAV